MHLRLVSSLSLFTASLVLAQSGPPLSGRVLDIGGDPVPNVAVEALNLKTKSRYKTTSSASGGYAFVDAPAGVYDVTVDTPGFNKFVQQNVTAPGKLDIHLFDFQLNTLGDGRDIRIELLTPRAVASGPTPRTPEGKPDFSGLWHPLRVTDPGKPEPLPWAAALMKERTENNTKDSPFSRCLPRGIALAGGLYPFKIVETRKEIIMLFEDWTPTHREIFLDGREHPKDAFPSWMGHAVGHWEGDTLVVDRTDFNEESWIDNSGKPHSDKLRVTERFRRPDLGHLEMETTFDDPGSYAKPWTMKGVYDMAQGDEVQEFICNENNKDTVHMVGK